jgi:hypothetical protein
MAVAIHFTPVGMSTAKYDECIRRLDAAGAGNPVGREYHACFGSDGSVQVVDVWTSVEAFQKFGETLMPILTSLGVDPGQPNIHPLNNVIVPSTVAAV